MNTKVLEALFVRMYFHIKCSQYEVLNDFIDSSLDVLINLGIGSFYEGDDVFNPIKKLILTYLADQDDTVRAMLCKQRPEDILKDTITVAISLVIFFYALKLMFNIIYGAVDCTQRNARGLFFKNDNVVVIPDEERENIRNLRLSRYSSVEENH